MEYEDTITLTGSSYYHNPRHSTEVSKTYSSWVTVDELLDGMKEIALALGYSEVSWNRGIQELADDIAGRELDDLLDSVDELDDEREVDATLHAEAARREVPCPCEECCRVEHRASRA